MILLCICLYYSRNQSASSPYSTKMEFLYSDTAFDLPYVWLKANEQVNPFLKKFYLLFIYFWLYWVFVAAHGLSLVVVGRGYILL